MHTKHRHPCFIFIALALSLLLSGCLQTQTISAAPEPTSVPPTIVVNTRTAIAPTSTPDPTAPYTFTVPPPTVTITIPPPTATDTVVLTQTPLPPTATATQPPAVLSDLVVHFIDVGQGDAILIQSPDGRNMLIDGGEKSNGVVAYLKSHGITKLDVVAATHPHSDHIGGLVEVLKSIPVDIVVTNGQEHTTGTYEDFLDGIIAAQAEYVEVMAGDAIQLGMLTIEVLGPVSLTDDLNNGSMVLRLVYGSTAFLFTGDAETKAESLMLGTGRPVKANILKVGHHGSDTSTSQAFLNAIQPEVAVYSSGVGNKYNHPNLDTMARLMAVADVYGTDTHGTVVVSTDGVTYQIATQKQVAPRAPPTVMPTAVQAAAPAQLSLEVLSLTSPISAGSTATMRVKTLPGADCTITVYYKSGASSAKGLEPKTAGANGEVSWSWNVGIKTTPGDWSIVVTASQGAKTGTQETRFEVK